MELALYDVIHLLRSAYPEAVAAINGIQDEYESCLTKRLDAERKLSFAVAGNGDLLKLKAGLEDKVEKLNEEVRILKNQNDFFTKKMYADEATIAGLCKKLEQVKGQVSLGAVMRNENKCEIPGCWCNQDSPDSECGCCNAECEACYPPGKSEESDETQREEVIANLPLEEVNPSNSASGGCMADFDMCVHGIGGPVECKECKEKNEAANSCSFLPGEIEDDDDCPF